MSLLQSHWNAYWIYEYLLQNFNMLYTFSSYFYNLSIVFFILYFADKYHLILQNLSFVNGNDLQLIYWNFIFLISTFLSLHFEVVNSNWIDRFIRYPNFKITISQRWSKPFIAFPSSTFVTQALAYNCGFEYIRNNLMHIYRDALE